MDLAATAYAAKVHHPRRTQLNGFDLRDLREDARGLWSVKNTTKRSDFRMTNGIGGAGAGFTDAVVFLSPALPGITFVDPHLHSDVTAQLVTKPDATVLPFRVVEEHARRHPECVAPCRMPSNPGTGTNDPWMDYVESLLSADRFPQRLSRLFAASKPVAGTLTSELQALSPNATLATSQPNSSTCCFVESAPEALRLPRDVLQLVQLAATLYISPPSLTGHRREGCRPH